MPRLRNVNLRQNRHDRFAQRTASEGKRRPTKEERRVLWDRSAKKYLRDKGLIGPKPKSVWTCDIGEFEPVKVVAYTRSEARALLKLEMGVKKLPPCIKFERIGYEPTVIEKVK